MLQTSNSRASLRAYKARCRPTLLLVYYLPASKRLRPRHPASIAASSASRSVCCRACSAARRATPMPVCCIMCAQNDCSVAAKKVGHANAVPPPSPLHRHSAPRTVCRRRAEKRGGAPCDTRPEGEAPNAGSPRERDSPDSPSPYLHTL